MRAGIGGIAAVYNPVRRDAKGALEVRQVFYLEGNFWSG